MSESQPEDLRCSIENCAIDDGPSSPQIDQLAKALSAAQADMQGAAMDARNPFFSSRYSSLGAVITASKAALGKHGLSILQKPTWTGDKLTMRTLLLHASGQWIDCGTLEATVTVPPPAPGKQARVSLVQAAGGLITYLRRYSRAAVCQLYSDEDMDGSEPPANHAPPEDPGYISPEPEPPPAHEPPPKTEATRMKVLNNLQAAPGQPNRGLITAYLRHRGWIGPNEEPEAWLIQHVPNTPRLVRELAASIAQWEADAKGGAS